MYLDIGSLLREADFGPDMNASIREAFPPSKMPTFKLKRGQHMYAIVGEHAKKQYCYTPHRANDGYFYTFEYVTVWRDPRMKTKKGQEAIRKARTPYERMLPKNFTKSRTRKLAYKRACDRYNAAVAASRKRKAAKGGIVTRMKAGLPMTDAQSAALRAALPSA